VAELHNAITRYTELLRGLKRVMALDSDAEGVSRLGETLTPILDVWSQPDMAIPRGEFLCAGILEKSAVAAEYTIAACWADAGTIVVVEGVYLRATAAVSALIGVDARAATTEASSKQFRDGRRVSDPQTHIAIETITPAPTSNVSERHWLGTTEIYIAGPWVLVGGGVSLICHLETVNIGLSFTLRWRERAILPGEYLL